MVLRTLRIIRVHTTMNTMRGCMRGCMRGHACNGGGGGWWRRGVAGTGNTADPTRHRRHAHDRRRKEG